MCSNDVFSERSKASSCPFCRPGRSSIPLMTRSHCNPPTSNTHTHTDEPPKDAHHPSFTESRTQADWLQFYTDDKSHKHCQRHSDCKKPPLKIHPGHKASYFKHSPSPFTVDQSFSVEGLSQWSLLCCTSPVLSKKKVKFLSLLMRSLLSCQAICAMRILQ